MMCSTCGGQDFEYEEGEGGAGPIRCVSCDRVFTREELISENGDNIQANVDEVKQAVLRDVKADLTKELRKAFGGSKHIKFR